MLRAMWILSFLAAASVGCEPPPPSVSPGPSPTVGPPSSEPPPAPPPPDRPVEPPPVVVDQGGPGAAPGSVPDGAACTAAADCASGICEGEGCAPNGGVCASKSRACTRDLRAYCGCDGVIFRSSGSCPGGRFSARGECGASGGAGGGGGAATGAADGAECKAGSDCASGICEGKGCGAADHGVCMAKNRPCTADLRPYCGCDGATFRSSGSCAGRRYSAKGACPK